MSILPEKGDVEEGLSLLQNSYYGKDTALDNDYYGSNGDPALTIGKPVLIPNNVDRRLSEIIYGLFNYQHHHSHSHPFTNPKLPPEQRFKRHRNYYIYHLNQFRHWWKTSRLLVRLAGGIVFCQSPLLTTVRGNDGLDAELTNWQLMEYFDVDTKRGSRQVYKLMKRVGQGGVIKLFLEEVHVMTRSIRIILAVARAWEARVDNRLYEVGLAEAFAFMGNRCSRYWARLLVDQTVIHIAFPISVAYLESYFEHMPRPIILAFGFLRALLPFAASFQGSRFGRQVTFNTYKYAAYRWKPVQSIFSFHEQTGTYQGLNPDPELLELARAIAEAVGHGHNPVETRTNLESIGWSTWGSGSGGYSVYRMKLSGANILLHITPYGPSFLDEMPRYIILDRRKTFYEDKPLLLEGGRKRHTTKRDLSDSVFLDAATPRAARVFGYTYSGAFFNSQEWAALSARYAREMADYTRACKLMGTNVLPADQRNPQAAQTARPPIDLVSLKAFIRMGRLPRKQRRDSSRFAHLQRQVKRMAKLIARKQEQGTAPKRVILYLEGLDCAGKSSTGNLIIDALEECGFQVRTAQHNRPPTAEQRKKPWMDRIRFEYPDDLYDDNEEVPENAACVWDRGPAGDFVYGGLQNLSITEKLTKYEQFRKYDSNCREEGVLFCKVFFVTDRDSIAKTLGKRLAHKKIARQLRAWHDANSNVHNHVGLDEVEAHIDPTDFVAFNRYEVNLANFSEFVRNTDHVGFHADSKITYENPWLVVCTSDRHGARMNIIKAFCHQLERFSNPGGAPKSAMDRMLEKFFGRKTGDGPKDTSPVPSTIVDDREYGIPARAVVQSFILLLLAYFYAKQTWDFDIEDIT